jgi:hypothetical protein
MPGAFRSSGLLFSFLQLALACIVNFVSSSCLVRSAHAALHLLRVEQLLLQQPRLQLLRQGLRQVRRPHVLHQHLRHHAELRGADPRQPGHELRVHPQKVLAGHARAAGQGRLDILGDSVFSSRGSRRSVCCHW